jgi:hypothetical protein
MSILNRPSDGLFNVLITLVRCLLIHGAMPRDKLLNLCAPPSAVDGQERTSQTINRWSQLGLLADDSGRLSIDTKKHKELSKAKADNATLARIIRSVVFQPENNERFWESENNQAADFTRALGWMLAQDVFEFDKVGHSDVQKIELDQLGKEASAFTNDTRWAGFKSWATFLGFGWIGRFPAGVFVIDPTSVVRDVLSDVFEKSNELPQSAFFSRLGEILPVVDGGEYRREVEEKIDRSVWSPPGDDEVSTSLSRALIRLHEAGEIVLDERADAEKRTLLGQGKRRVRNVSHILWKGSKR